MVTEQEPFSARRSCRAQHASLSTAQREFPGALDILLYSRDEFDYWKDSANHVVGRAQREGRVTMSDIKQANAMLRLAQRDPKALRSMLDASDQPFAGAAQKCRR